MLNKKTVSTSTGSRDVFELSLGDIRQLEAANKEPQAGGVSSLIRYLPTIHASLRKGQPDLTIEDLETNLTLSDFNTLFAAVLEVSGLRKEPGAEQITGVAPASLY